MIPPDEVVPPIVVPPLRPRQLELTALETPRLGTPLFALRLEGEPQRSAMKCTCYGGKPAARPDRHWATWRDAMVDDIRAMLLDMGDDWTGALVCPVIVGVVAVFSRPKGKKKAFTMKGTERPYPFAWNNERVPFVGTPDHDQVVKAAVDVCVQGGILLDDPLVVGYAGGTSRFYAAIGEAPHVEVRLWRA